MRVKWAKGEKKLKKIIIVNQISMEERGSLNKVVITIKKGYSVYLDHMPYKVILLLKFLH